MSLIFKEMLFRLNFIQVRNYTRWASRKPFKVIQPEEYEELERKRALKKEESLKKEVKIKWRLETQKSLDEEKSNIEEIDRPKKIKKQLKPVKAPETVDMLETVINSEGEFIYTKMKNNDSRVGMLLTTLKSRKEKVKKDLILLEGKRLIREALMANCFLKYLLFSRKDEVEYLKSYLPKSGAQLYKMPYREMQMWSDLNTTPGIMGIFKTPDLSKYKSKKCIPLTIVCDNIREPGNLGSVLRIAAGVGCERVILTKGCVNIWDPKVTRSASGSHFRIQILNDTFEELKKKISKEAKIFIADNNVITGDINTTTYDHDNNLEIIKNIAVIPYYSIKLDPLVENILIIGGETHGISLEAYKLASEFGGVRLNIPLDNKTESLNTGVALGIISFEMKKQINLSK